jgi:N-acetylglucosaminyldiphosphoundecaprenol N-acetyl-beta-D-mannosaminyltransferase
MTSTVSHESVNILGVPVSALDQAQLLEVIDCCIQERRKCLVLSGNVHSCNLAYEQEWLRRFFQRADIVRLDGQGLRWGATLLGRSLPPRTTWADFAWALAERASARSASLFFLGGRPGVAELAAARLRERHPALNVVGCADGYFDKSPNSDENEAILAQIAAVRPDMLIVGFGMPTQEKWLSHNLERIEATVILTGGAVFDYVSGELTRAPGWMTDHGMEWLGRLLIEPRRLWRRYLIGNPLFFWRVLKQKIKSR